MVSSSISTRRFYFSIFGQLYNIAILHYSYCDSNNSGQLFLNCFLMTIFRQQILFSLHLMQFIALFRTFQSHLPSFYLKECLEALAMSIHFILFITKSNHQKNENLVSLSQHCQTRLALFLLVRSLEI